MDIKDAVSAEELLPLLQIEAKSKELNVFVFTYEDLKDDFFLRSEKLGIALLAKDEDNAKYNLNNLRRCYLIKFV